MEKIIINENNIAKIKQAIDAVQHRCTARTITADDVFDAISEIEKRLGIAKKAMEDCVFCVDANAQNFPNAYKYVPESTWIRVEFRKSKWRLTNIYREKTASAVSGFRAELTDDAKNALIKKHERW